MEEAKVFERVGCLNSSLFPSFCKNAVTTVDLLEVDDEILMYFGGHDGDNERLGVAKVKKINFDALNWDTIFSTPIVDVGKHGSFDCAHVADPASVIFDNKILLYYSGLSDGMREDAVGLAISSDGVNFDKQEAPVLIGRAPEVVLHDGLVHLFYVLPNIRGGYSIHLATSRDGKEFEERVEPVLEPSFGHWDSLTVTTPRIFCHGEKYWMIYAGDSETRDTPKSFGLALSDNLVSWEKYGEPVFNVGAKGAWDDGAIWFGTVHRHRGEFYLFYEGCGACQTDGILPGSAVGVARLVNDLELI